MAKPSSHAKQLLEAITQAPTEGAPAARPRKVARRAQPRQPVQSPQRTSRKTSQIYFHPEDKQRLRELSAWLASQGLRVNDSLVIRSALRAVQMDSRFVTACQDAAKLDRRFKPTLA